LYPYYPKYINIVEINIKNIKRKSAKKGGQGGARVQTNDLKGFYGVPLSVRLRPKT
jgi:hypothetical protein